MLFELISFEVEDRSVLFANGQEEKDVDMVLFCTGHHYEYPFFPSLPDFEGEKGAGITENSHLSTRAFVCSHSESLHLHSRTLRLP